MTKKAYVGTFQDLQTHLNHLLDEGATIEEVNHISSLISNNSVVGNDIICVFIIVIK